MCRCANIPIQIAADGALYGKNHSEYPAAFGTPPPPPPPIVTDARPLSPCADPSHTERKHNTCVAKPEATAKHAFTTEPNWPDVSNPLPYQPHFSRSALIISYAPAPEKPRGS